MDASKEKAARSPLMRFSDIPVKPLFEMDSVPALVELLSVEDIPNGSDLRLIAECAGLEVALRIYFAVSRSKLYIARSALDPAKANLLHRLKRKFNPKELAAITGMSERWVYYQLNSK